MTARRPTVPRATRPTPGAVDGPVVGAHEGSAVARPARVTASKGAASAGASASTNAAPVRTGSMQRKPSVPRGAGPSATKDPRADGAVPPRSQRVAASSVHRSHGIKEPQPHAPGAGGRPGKTMGRPTSDLAHRSAVPQRTTSRAGSPVSPSQARAAERSQLAGSIKRGRLGSRRAESVIQPAEQATPVPAKTFSGRFLALALVVVVVIVLLAPSVSRYVQQQGELNALRADIALQQELQAEYRSDLARWDDPAFVRQQARERIFLVMPGETRYLVKGGTGIEEGTGEGSSTDPGELPWVDALWESVERAAND